MHDWMLLDRIHAGVGRLTVNLLDMRELKLTLMLQLLLRHLLSLHLFALLLSKVMFVVIISTWLTSVMLTVRVGISKTKSSHTARGIELVSHKYRLVRV